MSIVAGINFGMGSSAEDAPRSLRDAGIAAVLAESISNIYLRTLINLGLPAIECPGISTFVDQGDDLEVDLESGRVRNLNQWDCPRLSAFFRSCDRYSGERRFDSVLEILTRKPERARMIRQAFSLIASSLYGEIPPAACAEVVVLC